MCVLLLHYKVGEPEDAEFAEFTERDTNTLLEIRDDLDGVMTKFVAVRAVLHRGMSNDDIPPGNTHATTTCVASQVELLTQRAPPSWKLDLRS